MFYSLPGQIYLVRSIRGQNNLIANRDFSRFDDNSVHSDHWPCFVFFFCEVDRIFSFWLSESFQSGQGFAFLVPLQGFQVYSRYHT